MRGGFVHLELVFFRKGFIALLCSQHSQVFPALHDVRIFCPVAPAMSADPTTPVSDDTTTGRIVRAPWYFDGADKVSIEIATQTKFDLRVANQIDVPPYKVNMHREHPCFECNAELAKCSDRQPPNAVLLDRATLCWKERQELQKCLVRHRRWVAPPPKPWWKLW